MTNVNSRWVEPKSIFASKTIWINALTLVAGILMLLTQQTWVPESTVGVLLTVIGVVNVWLRFLTEQPVEIKKPPKQGD